MVNDIKSIPWIRVLIGTALVVILFSIAMSIMSIYRLSALPQLANNLCSSGLEALVCISYISESLLYDSQWLAMQFLIYLGLSFILWPILRRATGRPIINTIAIAILSTFLLALIIENAGIEFYASVCGPIFIGLFIQIIRNRQITFNHQP